MRSPPPSARRTRRRGAAIAGGLGLLIVAAILVAVAGHHRGRRAGAHRPPPTIATTPPATTPPTTATNVRLIVGRGRGRAVPPGFFGLSFEYWGLPGDENHRATFRRLLALLHPPGTGPMTIRIGGDSAQETFPAPRRGRLPRWAFGVGPGWIRQLSELIDAEHLRVILDLNQDSGRPDQAAGLARTLLRGLPHRSVVGFELGNEPDLFHRHWWRTELAQTPSLNRRLPQRFSPALTIADYRADARALGRVSRRIALLGPVVSQPRVHIAYIRALLAARHPHLTGVTVHEYPYAACVSPGSPAFPTVARLLSAQATDVMGSDIAPAVSAARRAGLPLRVTEFNSVTCHGRPGVSDAFATSLWAPGALFEMLSAGARSADLHARQAGANSPFHWQAGQMEAEPLLYGLLFFVRALGPDARLIPARLSGSASDVSVWALRLRGGPTHDVIVNRGAQTLQVTVPVGRDAHAAVTRLLAPGPSATTGVTVGGQSLDGDARWAGRRVITVARRHGDAVLVRVPPTSAALIAVTR